MKNVVALFSDPSDAEKAIKKLSDNGVDTSRTRIHSAQTIQQSTNVRAMPSANASISAGQNPAGYTGDSTGPGSPVVLTDDSVESYLTHIGVDAEQIAFFTHGIKEGGHVVLAPVSDKEAESARDALKEAGGTAPQVT